MFIEFKKFDLKFYNGNHYLYHGDTIYDGPLGVYNEGPPHDHNEHLGGQVYMEDIHPDMLLGDDREVMVAVFEMCSYHFGKDCSCKTVFVITPRLFGGRMLVDMYGLVKNISSEDDFYFH